MNNFKQKIDRIQSEWVNEHEILYVERAKGGNKIRNLKRRMKIKNRIGRGIYNEKQQRKMKIF